VIDGFRRAGRADAVLVRLRRGPWLELATASGLPPMAVNRLKPVLMSQQSLAARAATGVIARSDGVGGNGPSSADAEPGGFRSQLAVPLRAGETVIGVLDLRSERVGAFGFADTAFAEAVAAQIGLTIRARRLEARAGGGSDPQQVCLDSLVSVAHALEQGDAYFAGHSERVAWIAGELARAAGLPEEERGRIEIAARLHDVGMMGIPDTILYKSAELDHDEETLIELHPLVGERLCRLLPDGERIGAWVASHHERWDGTGYPEGLRRHEIPFESRLIAVADTYDALTSERPFRSAMGFKEALGVLREKSGHLFDPAVVAFGVELAPALERTLSERSRFLKLPAEAEEASGFPSDGSTSD